VLTRASHRRPKPTDVSQAEADALLLVAPGPFSVVPLKGVHSRVAALANAGAAALDHEVTALANTYVMDESAAPLASKVLMAQHLNLDRRQLAPKLGLFANVLLHSDRAATSVFADTVQRSSQVCSLFLELSRYDSTQLEVNAEDYLDHIVRREAHGVVLPLRLDAEAACPGPATRAQPTVAGKSSRRTSLLASEHKYAMLVRIGEGTAATFHAFLGESLTWIQLTDRSTAAAEKRALLESTCTFISADQFNMKVRRCTSDSASTNISVEKSISKDRGESWQNIHLGCNVHKVATGFTKTFALVESSISAMLNLSLSLSSSSALNTLRKAVAHVVAARLVVKVGTPPPSCREHQEACLDLFLGRGRLFKSRRDLLMTVLNGDWSETSRVTVWTPPGAAMPPEPTIVRVVQQTLILCCCGRSFTTYPRSRWVGADAATDEIGLLASIHGLLVPIYQLFARLMGKASAQP